MRIALVFCGIDAVFSEYPAGVFSIFESNPPLGLGAIGTVAIKHGYEVKIYDQLLLGLTISGLINELNLYEPDIIGFSCTSLNIGNATYCAKELKKDGRYIFAGGIHITLCTQKVLKCGAFDFLISGEGEEVFDYVLDSLEKNIEIAEMKCQGLWKDSDVDSGVAVLTNIDQPIIDRSIMDIHKYSNKGALLEDKPCYSLFSSRGCPYMCKFCSKPDYFKIYRQREIDNVISEIKYLIKFFGAKAISFREDNFTVDRLRLTEFCHRMIEEFKGDFYWECESRADMPLELLQLMYDAGCRGIWCGVETIVPKWSKWINKGLSKESAIKFYSDCEKIGIKTGALFMFGFPQQTQQEIDEDISFAINLPTVFSAFQCMAIFPGSPLTDYYDENRNLKYQITDDVALALIDGHSYKEMIEMEFEINRRIKSSRIQ